MTELRHATRALARSPGFSLIAIALVSVAIAGCTVVASLAAAVLVRPLAFHNPAALVLVRSHRSGASCEQACAVLATRNELASWALSLNGTASIAAGHDYQVTVQTPRGPEFPVGAAVTWNFFSVLESPRLALGRAFNSSDRATGNRNVAVLGYRYWQRAFGADPAVIGRTFEVNGRAFEVVGVLSATGDLGAPLFETDEPTVAYFVPLDATAGNQRNRLAGFAMIARLAEHASVPRLASQLHALWKREANPRRNAGRLAAERGQLPVLSSLASAYSQPYLRQYMLLLGATLMIALVIAANLVAMLTTRVEFRQHELAIRSLLGASRGAVGRAAAAEGVILLVVGAAAGFALAYGSLGALTLLPSRQLPFWAPAQLGGLTLPVCALLAASAGAACVAYVALVRSPSASAAALRGSGSDTRRAGMARASRVLIAVQLGLTLPLSAAGGAYLLTFISTLRLDPGIAEQRVVEGELYGRGPAPQTPAQQRSLADRALRALQDLPFARLVGMAGGAELPGSDSIWIGGGDRAIGYSTRGVSLVSVTPEFFAAEGTPLLRGRSFLESDGSQSTPVIILDEIAARKFFGSSNPVGISIALGSSESTRKLWRVVGVLQHATGSRLRTSRAPSSDIYFVRAQVPSRGLGFVVATRGNAEQALPGIRAALRSALPNVPVPVLRTVKARLQREIAPLQAVTLLLVVFALVGLLLSAAGVYSCISLIVAAREGEFAIRLALGAQRAAVVRVTLHSLLLPVAGGLGLGVAVCVGVRIALHATIYGVQTMRVPVLAAVCGILLASVAIGALVPIRRIFLLDPSTAMKG